IEALPSYPGVIGFNRNVNTGAILNPSYGAYQLHNYIGDLHLQVYNSAGVGVTEHVFTNSGNVGIGTTTPAYKLDVAGSIHSTMWNVTQVFNLQPGQLPKTSASFTTGGGRLIILAAGSAFANSTGTPMGFDIQVDGVTKGACRRFTNESGSHKTIPTNPFVVT